MCRLVYYTCHIKCPGGMAVPRSVTQGGQSLSTASLARSGRKGKSKCRSNSGKFLSLQADYRAGRLSGEAEERYEALCLELSRLYKGRS
jgi:hypothetical protein